MCMIVAYRNYKCPDAYYYPYSNFLGECLYIFSLELRIDCVYGLNKRKRDNHDTRVFFGVPIEYIYDFNVLELDEYLTKPKDVILKKPLEAWGE